MTTIITSIQLYLEYTNFEKEVITELSIIAGSFEEGLAKALWHIDTEAIESILNGIKKIELVDGVKVVDLETNTLGAVGAYTDAATHLKHLGIARAGNLQANEIQIHGINSGNYYEYTLGIVFEDSTNRAPELIGHMTLYTNHSAVIERFKYQFILIVVTAILKTIALWLIFLYFARRVVAKPLTELTAASLALSQSEKHPQKPENLKQLEHIAQSKNKDELQMLASGFLLMQNSIIEKLNNLHTLNEYAVRLSKTSSSTKAFEYTDELLCSLFGCEFTAIFDKDATVFWSSISSHEMEKLCIAEFACASNHFNAPFFGRKVTYLLEGAYQKSTNNQENTIPMLALPLIATGFENKQFRAFGTINSERLDTELKLTKESESVLQVVSAMISNCLTNIHQLEVIEEQNMQLEKRVEERTRELAKANDELQYQALHDPLTRLPNRILFNDRIEHLIKTAKRERRHFAVASIDLCKFKMINDNYGHDVGDIVLVEVSQRFSNILRASDTLSRMGGDEFAAILNDLSEVSDIEKIMEELTACLRKPVVLDDNAHVVASANIGLAIYPRHAQTSEQLFKLADIAMYQAKRENSGYRVFDITRGAKEKEITTLVNQLELAIVREELILHYQPIVDIKTNIIIGLEALVRWVHPEKGLIPPNLFIQHAEKSPHINPLTQWVLRAACSQCAKLKAQGHDITISVNLSPRVFTSPELPKQIKHLLRTYDLVPQNIKLEITESAAMTNPSQAMEILGNFKDMGSPISIDDFGTGHSSLAYLTKLPLDELKIDKAFLLSDSTNNRVIIETIIELAHAIDLKVVAEGIETHESRQMLINKGCDYAQGYLFGKPMEEEKILPLLQGGPIKLH